MLQILALRRPEVVLHLEKFIAGLVGDRRRGDPENGAEE